MILKKFEKLPQQFLNDKVYEYYHILKKKKNSIIIKRIFDLITASIMFLICLPIILLISIAIKIDSKGNVIFTQDRITQYGKHFKIYKFRTMINNAELIGAQVTSNNDTRITRVGNILRKYRLDELLQLVNIIKGDMSFVGTRPEVPKYVSQYTDEMYATLLLPAGVTSLASIKYKDEDKLLSHTQNIDDTYVNDILPQKMKYNIEYIQKFSFWYDIKLMFKTVFEVYKSDNLNNTIIPSRSDKANV